MPEAEIGDLIVELRSATAGAGSFTRQFDRMAEVTGRDADIDIAAHDQEFDAWQWQAARDMLDHIVPFKRPVYEAVLKEFDDLVK